MTRTNDPIRSLCYMAIEHGLIRIADDNMIRRARAAYKRNVAEPGDCKGDDKMLRALAVAEAHTGRGPGWIPVVQKMAVELAQYA
jgi:hypothetical protein